MYLPRIHGFRYGLLMVDQFSNYIYVKPLKTKTAESVRKAIDTIIEENELFKINTIASDMGKEYQGNVTYYKKKNIKWFFLKEPHKSFLAEGYVKIFKQVLYKVIRVSKGKPWTSFCQDVVDQINGRPLRKLKGKSPAQINSPFSDIEMRDEFRAQDGKKTESGIKTNVLPEGTLVFINLPSESDLRSYDLQRAEIKRVKKVDTSDLPHRYTLEDLEQENTLERKYYLAELKEVSKVRNIKNEIKRIYKSRRKNKRKEFLVSYYNRDGKHWIPERVLYAF